MPILKQSNANTKKRTRIDREMISAPLGDFRHTMHVGRGGDVFGDTSFLSNHGPASAPASAPIPPVEVSISKKNGLLKLADHDENKMADSLSQLSQSSGIGSGVGSVSSSPVNNVPSKEDSLWNNNGSGGHREVDWLSPGCGLKHAESILSFHLDLGPSILDDVLGVMDRDAPPSDWNGSGNQFDYKFNTLSAADNNNITPSPSIIESQGSHYSLSSTLPVAHPSLNCNSTVSSNNLEGNRSANEEDSEEEKRSVYEGVACSPSQEENKLHITRRAELDDDDDEDDEDDVSQGYAFEEDLDDEIGV